jgi:hypothetical protein
MLSAARPIPTSRINRLSRVYRQRHRPSRVPTSRVRRSRLLALLERHHRTAERGPADPPQHRGERHAELFTRAALHRRDDRLPPRHHSGDLAHVPHLRLHRQHFVHSDEGDETGHAAQIHSRGLRRGVAQPQASHFVLGASNR